MKNIVFGVWMMIVGIALDISSTVIGIGFFGATELNPIGEKYVVIFNLIALCFFVFTLKYNINRKSDHKKTGLFLVFIGVLKAVVGILNYVLIFVNLG